ncbi:acyl-CoA desaturase [Chloroflexia bacterium SDU3-3]|nr:acyl-CoA desaturase [Chloroflexia bacterium SDU3-3]
MAKSGLSGERIGVVIGVIAPLLGTLYAIVELWNRLVTWNDIILMLVLYVLTGVGITVGYHRMLTHRSFEPHPVVKFLFLAFGSMAVQGPAYQWAAVHIKHHAHTDEEDDPHSPIAGFFHAHVGWLFLNGLSIADDYGKWMKKDRMVMFFSRTFLLWVALGYLIPFLIGGWQGLLWGGLVRTFLNNHVTWSVNSVCHLFGSRMFETKDMSRNHWLVGLLAFGEGWHNNHHAFPRSAFHGMRWYQFDLSSYIIMLLEKVGLVKQVWRVPQDRLQARLAGAPGATALASAED